CQGSGAAPGTTRRVCENCGGTGQVQKVQSSGFGRLVRISSCGRCGGTGYTIDSPCKECRGRGAVERSRRIKLVIPAGVDDGHTFRMKGEGNAGENGSPPGDLYVVVNMRPHPNFLRQENDIYLQTKVGAVEATVGTDISVPTLYGDVKLSIPSGTQPGTIFKVKGKGMPKLNGWGKGDQYVKLEVVIPKSITGTQKELLKKFLEESQRRNL
ncbi:MAG TPA: DnaJ C-terminal domain-containing protein, partial [Nitrososphaerales archaeon]|nr:DnaJ C-terminal domain-containing protein [Nitrososphaerales archaeon]